MKYTSAEANKLLRELQEQRNALLTQESQGSSFVAATIENAEDVRPDYDYAAVSADLAAVEAKIRTVKHCINQFNLSHCPAGFDMTVDQLLVYIPQLTERKGRLSRMANVLPKTRVPGGGSSNIIEYEYVNYDLAQVKADYQAVSDTLARAQLALDRLNTTETMEIEI